MEGTSEVCSNAEFIAWKQVCNMSQLFSAAQKDFGFFKITGERQMKETS